MKLELLLQERLKELHCLLSVSALENDKQAETEQIFTGIVALLPPAWQYPEITTAILEIEGHQYRTDEDQKTPWRQTAPIQVTGQLVGEITVAYTAFRPPEFEGPFLWEERQLLNAVAEHVSRIIDRSRVKRKLRQEERALKEKNIALVEVLGQMKTENYEIAQRIQTNIDRLVLPVIRRLEADVPAGPSQDQIRLLGQTLGEITAPLYSSLKQEYANLTPKEMRICVLISRGYATKEIAQLEGIAEATVHRHREHIRHKLKLTNTAVNLERFLQRASFPIPESGIS